MNARQGNLAETLAKADTASAWFRADPRYAEGFGEARESEDTPSVRLESFTSIYDSILSYIEVKLDVKLSKLIILRPMRESILKFFGQMDF